MMGSPTVHNFRAIGWGIPSRWKTIRTSDELPRSRQLADGELTVPQSQINRRAKLLARPERPMYVSKSPAETWEGPLRTHRRTARLSIWLVHFWALDDEAQVALYRAHTEPLGTWVGVTARTVHLAA